MSNALSTARTELAAAATEGSSWKVHPHVPGRITPPIGAVTPGSPYLEPGETFGSFTVRYVVSLISRTGANDFVTDELDEAITETVVALVNAGYGLESVSQPYALDAGNAQYLAVDLTTTTTITL